MLIDLITTKRSHRRTLIFTDLTQDTEAEKLFLRRRNLTFRQIFKNSEEKVSEAYCGIAADSLKTIAYC